MLADFNFHLLQLRYVQAAADQIGAYTPDGLDATELGLKVDAAKAVRQEYVDKKTDFDLARGTYRQSVNDGHDATIGVYAAMKSRFRKDQGSLEAINNLPVADQTAAETTQRMVQTSTLWGKLPLFPGKPGQPAQEFVAWQGMDHTVCDGLLSSIATNEQGIMDSDEAFQVAEGNLHKTDADIQDFVTASLQQGRAQFPDGMEREVIDSIPTEPSTHEPNQAVISVFSSPGAGKVHLEFDANHGTSFDVLQKGPGEADFSKVSDDQLIKTYDKTGLSAGVYQYQVIGQNSLGNGEPSAVVSVTVG
jgi:hypothetical protein